MKLITLLVIFSVCAAPAFGQAYVLFSNRSPTLETPVVAPVYGVNPAAPQTRMTGNSPTDGGSTDYTGVPLLIGPTYTASLWAAPSGTGVVAPTFELLGSTAFRTIVATRGFWALTNGVLLVPFVTEPQANVQFQVRVWNNDNGAITTWAAALASGSEAGYSGTFTVLVRNDPNSTPVPLVGLTSFNLTVVPEPGVFAIGFVGALLAVAASRLRRK